MSFSFYEVDAVTDILALREVIIYSVFSCLSNLNMFSHVLHSSVKGICFIYLIQIPGKIKPIS